jgi:hydrogenase 3 maturation protease
MTIVIIGVGNRMRSDDGVGSLVAQDLLQYKYDNLTVYDSETSPENYIEKVVSAKPDWVIFVDACNYDVKPGEFKLFEGEEIADISYGLLSTHTLPLTLMIELIKKQHNCRISLVGIQPKSFSMGEDLSTELQYTRGKVVEYLKSVVKNNQS